MSTTRVYITSHDPIVMSIYGEEETKEFFGEDFLEEYGLEIPQELYNRYVQNLKEFEAITREITSIINGK